MTTLASARGRDYHNEIRAERDKLRAEVERLTRERAGWKEAAFKADGSRVAAIARAETAERKLARERDEAKQLDVNRVLQIETALARAETAEARAEAAERKLAMAVETLSYIAHTQDLSRVANTARITLAALENNDE